MLITTIEELRLASPAHALDTIDGLAGYIDNSEHEFLKDKLGTDLYDALCDWYEQHPVHNNIADSNTSYYNQLLLLAQRCIAFDALGRAIGTQIISVHNSGVNVPTADDYEKPKKEDIDTYRQTCNQEAHASLNRLLQTLEEWSIQVTGGSAANTEQQTIVSHWKNSRYYYLAAGMLIPSAVVLQRYLNFYENREKFVQMLPDLLFIQEEVIASAIGDELLTYLVGEAAKDDAVPPTTVVGITIHKLRKVIASLLVGRTAVLRFSKEEKIKYHDEGVRMFQSACTYITAHQGSYDATAIAASPLYQAPSVSTENPATFPVSRGTASAQSPSSSTEGPAPACWTPPLL